MKKKLGLILGIIAALALIKAGLAQEETAPVVAETKEEAAEAPEVPAAVPETQTEPQIQWLWGEVVSVDAENKMLVVKYLDYEADQEKEINISVDSQTTYENVKSITEIRPKEAASIDYVVDAEGKNIAKNISIEQPEGQAMVIPEAQSAETQGDSTPEDLQPAPVTEQP